MQAIFENFGIYLHVPFCASECEYCRFYKKRPTNDDIIYYVDTIEHELSLLENENHSKLKRPETMFWGGGTPSVLPLSAIERLSNILSEVIPEKEWTVEVAPTSVSDAKLSLLKDIGVTRISMGVQSFSENTLKTLGRFHTLKATEQAIEKIANHNFKNFSIDLIFGSENQTLKDWTQDLEKAVSMPVNHISAYCLEFESATSCCGGNGSESDICKQAREAEFLEIANTFLPSKGFNQYEISNYAKSGGECLHNISTWHMAEWLGLGPSAASQWRKLRRRNTPDFDKWAKGICASTPLYEDIVELDDDEMFSSAIIFGLRMNKGIILEEISKRFPNARKDEILKNIDFLKSQGLLEEEDKYLRLTPAGRPLADSIALELL